MSKFDVTAARQSAEAKLAEAAKLIQPEKCMVRDAKRLLAACDYIAKLERVKDAAGALHRKQHLDDNWIRLGCALAACDDGEGTTCDESSAGSTSGPADTAKRSPKPERRKP